MSESKTVPVYVHDTIVENITVTITIQNGHWTTNVVQTGRIMAKLQSTINSAIQRFTVYEDRVVFETA